MVVVVVAVAGDFSTFAMNCLWCKITNIFSVEFHMWTWDLEAINYLAGSNGNLIMISLALFSALFEFMASEFQNRFIFIWNSHYYFFVSWNTKYFEFLLFFSHQLLVWCVCVCSVKLPSDRFSTLCIEHIVCICLVWDYSKEEMWIIHIRNSECENEFRNWLTQRVNTIFRRQFQLN